MSDLIYRDSLCNTYKNWMKEIREDSYEGAHQEYEAILACLSEAEDSPEVTVPHWVRTSDHLPSEETKRYVVLVNGFTLHIDILTYGRRSIGDMFFDATEDTDEFCFYYNDDEWGFTKVSDEYVLFWLDGLELPKEI